MASRSPKRGIRPDEVPLLTPVARGYEHNPPKGQGRSAFERRMREVYPGIRGFGRGLRPRESDGRRWVLIAGLCGALEERRGLVPGWNTLREVLAVLRHPRLPASFGVEYDVVRYLDAGTSHYARRYLDAGLGWLLTLGGEPVVALAMNLGRDGAVYLTQVQLVNRHGNRWLFRARPDVVTWAARILETNFPGRQIFVADGASVAASVREAYLEAEAAPTEAELARVAAQYDRAQVDRSRTVTHRSRTYHPLLSHSEAFAGPA